MYALAWNFSLRVDAALDLPLPHGLDDGRHAVEEVVAFLLAFDAVVERLLDLLNAGDEGLPGAPRDLVAHEDAELVELLPLAVQGQQGADLEVAGGDVEGVGELGPFVEVLLDLPVARRCCRR